MTTKDLTQTNGLEAWADRLATVDMPALTNVVGELKRLTGDPDADASKLAAVITRDANLTTQILKVSNSVLCRPGHSSINTVTRAIVQVGFEAIRSICLSILLIEALMGDEPKERMLHLLANAFHAAVQARNVAEATGNDNKKEEVFVAALLFHLAEMAFWSFGGASAEQLDAKLSEGGVTEAEAVREVIGTSFKALSRELANAWSLGGVLEEALSTDPTVSAVGQCVRMGDRVSTAALQGWDSKPARSAVVELEKMTGMERKDIKTMLVDGADEAAKVARTYGAARACQFIPGQKREKKAKKTATVMVPDPQLQLAILRDISACLSTQADVNTVFKMMLEGLHKGVGFERVLVAFVAKNMAVAKYVLGEDTDRWRDEFRFSIAPSARNLFSVATAKKEVILVKPSEPVFQQLIDPAMKSVLGNNEALVSAISIGQRTVALVYADRGATGVEIQQEQFQSFSHFIMQTQMALQMLAAKR